MKILPLLAVLVFISGCASVQKQTEVLPWPAQTSFLYGEGDVDMRSPKERFSGSFIVRMVYPETLFFEVYGTFGQTLVHLEKDGGTFLLISGEEKTTDEESLVHRFGFTTKELMDDLALQGTKRETPEGLVSGRGQYRVVYGHDRRGRRTMCWERTDDRLCLTFTQADFTDK